MQRDKRTGGETATREAAVELLRKGAAGAVLNQRRLGWGKRQAHGVSHVNTGVRQSPMADVNAQRNLGIAEALDRLRDEAEATAAAPSRSVEQQARVFIAAENRLLREALC